MGPDEFRRLANGLPAVEEKQHMHHPDFRVGGKIFATLGYPDEHWAMVKLTAAQQKQLTSSHAGVFSPVKGAWGRQGCTGVCLRPATRILVKAALKVAWGNVAPKKLQN